MEEIINFKSCINPRAKEPKDTLNNALILHEFEISFFILV
jgi:hypothetical protein